MSDGVVAIEEVAHGVAEGVVAIAGDHVARAGDVFELGVRNRALKLAHALETDHVALAPAHEQGRYRHCRCGAQQAFVNDFVAAFGKVMNLDRFDL